MTGKLSVVILDVGIPPPDGLEVARLLREEKAPVEIILVTMYCEEAILAIASSLHLSYVLKDSVSSDIAAALEAASLGECYTSPLLHSLLAKNPGEESNQAVQELLPVEQRVIHMISQYKTSKEIAEEMDILSAEVELCRSEICRKLGLDGNHALMKFALNFKAPLS